MKAGNVTFHSGDKGNYNAALNSDGTYSVFDVPTGTMKVSIDTEYLNPNREIPDYSKSRRGGGGGGSDPRARAAAPAAVKGPPVKAAAASSERMAAEQKAGVVTGNPGESAGRYVKIPAKYASVKTSGLVVTVEAGSQVKDFDLVD